MSILGASIVLFKWLLLVVISPPEVFILQDGSPHREVDLSGVNKDSWSRNQRRHCKVCRYSRNDDSIAICGVCVSGMKLFTTEHMCREIR
jgi:hypothetical protein